MDKDGNKYIVENKDSYKLVHYFADEPKGKYACVNKPELYEQFGKIETFTFLWDIEFENDLKNAHYLPPFHCFLHLLYHFLRQCQPLLLL